MWLPRQKISFIVLQIIGQLEPGHEVKNDWINLAKDILIHIQLRDKLEKTIVVRDHDDDSERRILLKPNSLEEESFA
jgi:hypothetical protein